MSKESMAIWNILTEKGNINRSPIILPKSIQVVFYLCSFLQYIVFFKYFVFTHK